MSRSFFLRHIKSTFAACAVLMSCGLCLAQPSTTVAQGELRLDGSVTSFNVTNGDLVLSADSFTVASGKSSAINPAKPKSIAISAQTQIVNTEGAVAAKSTLKNGAHIAVIGADGGSGKALKARLVILLDMTSPEPIANNPTNNKNTLHAGEYLLNGQIKGVFSAETIIIDVYMRVDAQEKVDELGQPVEQKLHLGANTKIISAEDATKALTIGDIKLGQRVAVVGKYDDDNTHFNARLIKVAKEETQNLEKIGVVSVYPQTAKLLDQGESALNAGAYGEALQYYTKASQIAGSLGDTGGSALAQSYSGMVYQYLNQPQKALAAFNLSISLSNSIGNYSASAVTMSNLGDFYLRQKDYPNSLKSFSTALGWIDSNNFNGKEKLRMGILQSEASALFQSQQPDKAIEVMQQSIALAQQFNNIERQGAGYLTLAFWQINTNQTDEAKNNAKRSADLIPQLKKPAEQAQSWEQLYLFYRIINDVQEAQNAYDQAKQILTNLKDEDGLKKLQELKESLDKRAKDEQTPK